jgi:hypothetical protein
MVNEAAFTTTTTPRTSTGIRQALPKILATRRASWLCIPTIPYTQSGVFGRGVGGRVAADA